MEMSKGRLTRIFSKIPTLETQRLTLRKLLPEDYRDMFEYASLERVTEYLLWSPHQSPDQTYRYLESLQNSYRRGEFFDWAVVLRTTGKMIGTCGFTSFELSHARAEVGYVLNPAFWGQGIAKEAVMAVTSFAFSELGMNRIEAHYIEGNERSLHVMQACGMEFEGMFRQYMLIKGRFRNIGICAVTADRFPKEIFYGKKPSVGWLRRRFM